MSPRAYDLVGNMMNPAEAFPRLEALEAMSRTLEAAGHADAAVETREYLAEARDFAELTQRRLNRLRSVWLAVEMTDGPGTSPADRQAKVDTAVDAYRNLGSES